MAYQGQRVGAGQMGSGRGRAFPSIHVLKMHSLRCFAKPSHKCVLRVPWS